LIQNGVLHSVFRMSQSSEIALQLQFMQTKHRLFRKGLGAKG